MGKYFMKINDSEIRICLKVDPSILRHILISESLKWEQVYVLQWKKFIIIMLAPIYKASAGRQVLPKLFY